MNILALDHLVFSVKNIQAPCDFYATVLGMDSPLRALQTFVF